MPYETSLADQAARRELGAGGLAVPGIATEYGFRSDHNAMYLTGVRDETRLAAMAVLGSYPALWRRRLIVVESWSAVIGNTCPKCWRRARIIPGVDETAFCGHDDCTLLSWPVLMTRAEYQAREPQNIELPAQR